VTRSGSKDFRGSAAFYKRDDSLNGNEFSRKQQCGLGVTAQCSAPLYTFNNTAWTLGGPAILPGVSFNKGRNKLFFFWSQDILLRLDPGTLNQRRMPTAPKRWRFLANAGRLELEEDDLHPRPGARARATARLADRRFADNRIPPTASIQRQALLNLFPMPNASDPTEPTSTTTRTRP
jgi:hypothetical protein